MIMAAAIGIPNTKNAMKLTKNNAMLDIYLSSSPLCALMKHWVSIIILHKI